MEMVTTRPQSPLAMAAEEMLESEGKVDRIQSPLAMAAADMVDGEDELAAYWRRYEKAKHQPDAMDGVRNTKTARAQAIASAVKLALSHLEHGESRICKVILERLRPYVKLLETNSTVGSVALLDLAYIYEPTQQEEHAQ